jgi:hypothetical protein
MVHTQFPEQPADRFLEQTKIIWLRPSMIMGVIITMYLLIGLFVVNQYGESIDEPPRMAYAELSSQSYSGGSTSLQDEKGPFFGMVALQGAKILEKLIPSWKIIDGWNYMSFIAFVMGVYFFYRLCRRLFNAIPAISITLLFSSQPIIWGHAFINPKDIPFMSFFLASITLGLEMVDHWQQLSGLDRKPLTLKSEVIELRRRLPVEWSNASLKIRRTIIVLAVGLAAILIAYPIFRRLINWVVRQIYLAPTTSRFGQIFQHFAQNANSIPVDAYISKAQTLIGWLIFLVVTILAGCLVFISSKIFPTLSDRSIQLRLLLAGCFLGFASDIRTLGPAAGILVGMYFLYKGRQKVIPYIFEYIAIGAVVIFIFWPNLWRNPITGYLASLGQASDFPFNGSILFAGVTYNSENLPHTFLPTLLSMQFTEPFVLLFLLGLILAFIIAINRSILWPDILLLFAWSIGPVVAAVLLDSTIYNNFRQFLFIVPALFIIAGLAIQYIWIWLKGRLYLFIPFMLLVLLPGLYWNWQLHPYQYVYYNNFAGGEATASYNYDMDYWFTTYKEGAEYVNHVAPENSVVYFWNNYTTALPYIRSDLKLTADADLSKLRGNQTIYAVIATQNPGTQFIFARSKVVYEIIRGGAVLAVVKQVDLSDYAMDNQ